MTRPDLPGRGWAGRRLADRRQDGHRRWPGFRGRAAASSMPSMTQCG